jgi:hypothetical protein
MTFAAREKTMKKEQTSTQETSETLAQMLPWRQSLFERLLRVVAIVALPMLLVSGYYTYTIGQTVYLVLALVGYAMVAVGAFLPRIPYVWRVWGLLAALIILGTIDLWYYGWGEDGRIYLMTATLFATVFLGGRHSLAVLIISVVIVTLFVVLFGLGVDMPQPYLTMSDSPATLVSGLFVFIACVMALFASFNNLLPRVFDSLQRSAQLSADLEARQYDLAERMRVLQDSNLSLQRQAMYIDAGVQTTRGLMQHFEVEPLLERAVQLISRHFDFPHVAIFLLDETGVWLVLRAASSSAGQTLATEGYRLKRSAESALGRVFETRQPYIARSNGGTLNADLDAAHLAQPGLPAAQSAVLLPLVIAGEALGVLDIHSHEEVPFDQDSLRALEGVAWQIAVALDNARRLSGEDSVLEMANPFFRLTQRLGTAYTEAEVQTAILELLQVFRPGHAYIVQETESVRDAARQTAYLVTDLREESLHVQHVAEGSVAENFGAALTLGMALETPLFIADVGTPPDLPETGCADFCRRLVEDPTFAGENRSVALIPLCTDEKFFGLVTIFYDTTHSSTSLEMQTYHAIGEFGGVMLERIALLDEAQTRLAQERWLREFSERMLQTSDLEMMLAEAARSLQDVAYADGVTATLTLPEARTA